MSSSDPFVTLPTERACWSYTDRIPPLARAYPSAVDIIAEQYRRPDLRHRQPAIPFPQTDARNGY